MSGEALLLTPTRRYYRATLRASRKVSTGIDRVPDALLGALQRRPTIGWSLGFSARRAHRLAAGLAGEALDARLLALHAEFRRRRRAPRRAALAEGLAAVAAAAREIVGLDAHAEQLMGALALERGLLAEMATGEGKTLTVALAAALAAWRGNPCHVVTANDYLAERDAAWLAPFYARCGLSVGHIAGTMDPGERRANYECSVVYCTSQELLADFLRDRLRLGADSSPGRRLIRSRSGGGVEDGALVLRGLHTAIVDEADSILIDEAVTPLVIGHHGDDRAYAECCRIAGDIARELVAERDYRANARDSEVRLLDPGIAAIARLGQRLPAEWRSFDRRHELVRQALVAREFFIRGKHYIVADGKVEIVDEFTGRLTPGRTWRQGLHQANEAKEGIALTDPTETVASMSFQRFFRMFHHLAGLTGTARESAGAFWHIYRLPVVTVPTHRRCRRRTRRPRVFAGHQHKLDAVVAEIERQHRAGSAVLVGTRTVEASEELSQLLAAAGIAHQVLNAVQHREEAAVIAEAGAPGCITLATNMAGRGTDIKLADEVRERGGLVVLITERHTAGRIDRQLAGRTARQGEPGEVRYLLSVDDELPRRFLPHALHRQLLEIARWRIPGWRMLALAAFNRAQRNAERLGARQRHQILSMDTWLDEHLAFAREDYR